MFPLHQTSAKLCVTEGGVRHCMDVRRGEDNALPAEADAWEGVYAAPDSNHICCNASARCGKGTHTFPAGGGCFAPDALNSSSWTHNTRVELVLMEGMQPERHESCKTRFAACESLKLASTDKAACSELCDLSGAPCATQSATPYGSQLPGYFNLRCEAAQKTTPPNA